MARRAWPLAACMIVIAGTVFLAAGLDRVHFEPARPFAFSTDSSRPFALSALSIPDDTPLWEILALWLAIVINLCLVLLLLSPELRKRVLKQVLRFAVGALLFLLLLRSNSFQLPGDTMEPPAEGQLAVLGPAAVAETPAFTPPEPSSWLSLAIGLTITWLALLALFIAYRAWSRRSPRRVKAMDAIADIARGSLADLASGRAWGDVVIQSYASMNDAVHRIRGLQRASSDTAREFSSRLARIGLPAPAIDELTRLFEAVRYGGQRSDPGAGNRARACLESIVRACESVV